MTDKPETGGPAYPAITVQSPLSAHESPRHVYHAGMTLRDAFAMAALTGILSRMQSVPEYFAREVMKEAYDYADAALERRKL